MRKSILTALMPFFFLVLVGCPHVPRDAVTLSQTVGNDIEQLYVGYRKTIEFSFDQLRRRGLTVIDERWTPIYLQGFIEKGGLVGFAQANNTDAVEYWARKAVKRIDEKRKEFLKPLEKREAALLRDLDDAFGRVIRANAAVTAHLNSVVKVQETQNQVLDAAGLKEIREKINNAIVDVSKYAEEATERIEVATKKLEDGQ